MCVPTQPFHPLLCERNLFFLHLPAFTRHLRLMTLRSSLLSLASCLLCIARIADAALPLPPSLSISTSPPVREYGIFMGLQYYGPPVTTDVYARVAAAARRLPLFVSVCADHNDTSGGAEHRRPGGDPLDGTDV